VTGIENRPKHPKIAIINRRFWPISGAAELEVANLCRSLTAAHYCVDILTVRWQKHWPVQVRYHECDVHRLTKPSSGPFGTFRYLKALTAHLSKHAYDGIIAFGIGEEAFTAAAASKNSVLVLRVTQLHLNGLHGFSNRQNETLKSATEILVDTPSTADFIRRHQREVENRIKIVPPIAALPDELNPLLSNQPDQDTEARKTAARVALSDAHPILQIDSNQPLVVTCAPMEDDLGVCDLVQAWKAVQRKHTKSRLWILGEGKRARAVWDAISELDLVYTVIMPGFFDNLSLVLDAADLYVHPLRTESACCVLQTAKAQGVCTVETASLDDIKSTAATESTRPFIESPDRGLLVPRETPTALSATISYLVEHEDFATTFGQEVQRRFLNRANRPDAESSIRHYLSALPNAVATTDTP